MVIFFNLPSWGCSILLQALAHSESRKDVPFSHSLSSPFNLFNTFIWIYFIYRSDYFSWMYICVPYVCLVPVKVRRGVLIFYNWSYKWLWVTRCVLENEPGHSARATSALNRWTTSQHLLDFNLITYNWRSIKKECIWGVKYNLMNKTIEYEYLILWYQTMGIDLSSDATLWSLQATSPPSPRLHWGNLVY